MRALIVDDSRSMRAILRHAVAPYRFVQLIEAGSGREALAALAALPPEAKAEVALALVDWNMPEMNGYDLIRALRADPAWGRVRIMMVTTENELPQIERALAAGADEFVMKPFTPDVIEQKLAMLGFEPAAAAAPEAA
jgi:two-component system chemotaxis response regulator CheY